MLALACLSLDSVGSSMSVVNLWFFKLSGRLHNFYLFLRTEFLVQMTESMTVCVCIAMGEIQSADPKYAFCFMGDFNCLYSEWLGSHATNAHEVTSFAFATLTDCSQLVCRPTNRGWWHSRFSPDRCPRPLSGQ